MSLARVQNFSFSRDGFGMRNTQAMSITVPRYSSRPRCHRPPLTFTFLAVVKPLAPAPERPDCRSPRAMSFACLAVVSLPRDQPHSRRAS
jgi:hypothetical protein